MQSTSHPAITTDGFHARPWSAASPRLPTAARSKRIRRKQTLFRSSKSSAAVTAKVCRPQPPHTLPATTPQPPPSSNTRASPSPPVLFPDLCVKTDCSLLSNPKSRRGDLLGILFVGKLLHHRRNLARFPNQRKSQILLRKMLHDHLLGHCRRHRINPLVHEIHF